MTPLIATHAFAALTSLLLGAWQLFFSRKGSPLHRFVGRTWVVLMLYVSVTSFWIRELRSGQFSLLHVLSVVTIITVSLGFVSALRGDIPNHVGNMIGTWIGLSTAFVFAVAVPDRAIPQFVITEPIQAASAGLAVVVTTLALVGAGRLLAHQPVSTNATVTSRTAPPAA